MESAKLQIVNAPETVGAFCIAQPSRPNQHQSEDEEKERRGEEEERRGEGEKFDDRGNYTGGLVARIVASPYASCRTVSDSTY